jgi:hypothetical protein
MTGGEKRQTHKKIERKGAEKERKGTPTTA